MKILAKKGISVISSYRGGYEFEALGLSRALVAEYFPGVTSRISGIGLSGIEQKLTTLHLNAWGEAARHRRSAASTRCAPPARPTTISRS